MLHAPSVAPGLGRSGISSPDCSPLWAESAKKIAPANGQCLLQDGLTKQVHFQLCEWDGFTGFTCSPNAGMPIGSQKHAKSSITKKTKIAIIHCGTSFNFQNLHCQKSLVPLKDLPPGSLISAGSRLANLQAHRWSCPQKGWSCTRLKPGDSRHMLSSIPLREQQIHPGLLLSQPNKCMLRLHGSNPRQVHWSFSNYHGSQCRVIILLSWVEGHIFLYHL